LAAYAVRDDLLGRSQGLLRYEALMNDEYARYLAAKKQVYGQERRWRGTQFWKIRANVYS
jgi:hypothetical protein